MDITLSGEECEQVKDQTLPLSTGDDDGDHHHAFAWFDELVVIQDKRKTIYPQRERERDFKRLRN